MSSTPITPDVENDPVAQSNLGASLSTVQGASGPVQVNTNSPDFNQSPNQPSVSSAPQPTSRLKAVLSAVANTVETGLSGIPTQGRPSFVNSLGQGARAEQASQQYQNQLKFKSLDDQIRLAQLHNEDVRMQNADEDHQAAVQANADAQAKRMTDTTGMTYTFLPNSDGGQEVLDHMTGQMAQNGSVSIPAGTISGPKGWYVPNQGSAEQAQANTKDYNMRAQFYGLPSIGKAVVNPKLYDALRGMSNGFDLAKGDPMHADALQSRVDNMTEQLAKFKENPNADQNTIAAVQSDITHLTNLQKITAQREKTAISNAQSQQLDTLDKSEKIKAKYAEEKSDNAASNKTQSASGSVVGFDPQSNERVVLNTNDPRAASLTQSGKVSSKQMDDWGTSQNQFANVQLAVSRYDQAARTFAQGGKPSDAIGINSALNKSGVGEAKIGEWGVSIPGFSSLGEAASRVANSAAFKALSPSGQDLVDKYFRMMSSIPEYQKASTGIGRTNKEMLDLELKNIPDPTMPPSIISNRLSSFQEALSSNASRVPHIQGIPHYKDVQQHYQPQQQQQQQPQQTAPSASNLGKAVSGQSAVDVVNSLR